MLSLFSLGLQQERLHWKSCKVNTKKFWPIGTLLALPFGTLLAVPFGTLLAVLFHYRAAALATPAVHVQRADTGPRQKAHR